MTSSLAQSASKPARPSRKQLQSARDALVEQLAAGGYRDLRWVGEQLCGVHRFNFTTAIVVGLDPVGYQRRYCYEHAEDARTALAAWNGKDHPSGPWIKCKGGGIDLLNPDFR